MRDRMGMSSRLGVTKKRKFFGPQFGNELHAEIRLRGKWEVEKYREPVLSAEAFAELGESVQPLYAEREDGCFALVDPGAADEPYEVVELANDVTAAGIDDFLNLIAGLGGSHYTTAATDLRIYTSGPTLEKTLGCANGPTVANNGTDAATITWRFDDISIDVYTIYRLDVYNSSSTTTFSQALASGNPFGDGDYSKPNSENWIYTYTLTLDGSGSNLQASGLHYSADLFVDNENFHWNGTYTNLSVEDSGGASQIENVPAGSVTIDTADNKMTAVWTIPATGGADQAWYRGIVHNQTLLSDLILHDGNDFSSTKSGNEEWEVTFVMTVT